MGARPSVCAKMGWDWNGHSTGYSQAWHCEKEKETEKEGYI